MHACKLLHQGYSINAAANKLKDLYPQFEYLEMWKIVSFAFDACSIGLVLAALPEDQAHVAEACPQLEGGA